MPGSEVAQYGIGFFAVAGMIYLVAIWLKEKQGENVTDVIKNNTEALEKLTTAIQVPLAKQEAKLDEVVDYVRRCKGA